MVLSRPVGLILIGLIMWAVLIIIGRVKNQEYRNLRTKLTRSKGATESDDVEPFWKHHDELKRPSASHQFTLEENYLYYYTHSMNYLGIAFVSIIALAFIYYLPLALTSYFGFDNISTILMTLRKYVQVLFVVVTFFGLFAYHRCQMQLEFMYEELVK